MGLLLLAGIALAAKSYPDRPGDVTGGSGPDMRSITISNTATTIGSLPNRARFAKARERCTACQHSQERWIDMLLIAIDRAAARPTAGHTRRRVGLGANFALGTHGPAKTGQLVRLGNDASTGSRRVATFKIVTRGSTLTFSITRRALGSPSWFTFNVAAARERQESTGGGIDLAPARGTFRYALT